MHDEAVRRIAKAGVLAAAIILLTTLVSIPLPGGHGYLNLGDAGVLTAAYLLGNPWGLLCAGVASALSDVLVGWAIYAPATFVIKGLMAFVAAVAIRRLNGKRRLLAFYPAALIVPVGYLLYEALLFGPAAALPNVPLNLLQCLLGAAVAHAVAGVMERRK